MKASIKRITKGLFREVRGNAKRITGSLLANRKMRAKGRLERITGKVHRKIGKVQGRFGF